MSVQSPMPSDYSSGLLLIERDMYGGEDEEHAARLGGRKEVGWRQQHSKQIFGLLVVFGIVASWAGSAELANYSEKRAHFDKPFFIVYLNSAWNVLILPLFLGFQFLSSRVSKLFCTSGSEEEELTLNPIMDIHKLLEQEDMSVKKLFFASAISVFNLSIADYLYFRALSLTSASSGIVIFNLSSIVTYFLSLFLLDEEFSILKGFAVLLSFGGAALVVFSDKISGGGKLPSSVIDDDSHEWVGDLVMAGGATFWGIYLVCYKKFIGDPGYGIINLQSTLMGIISLFCFWPVLIILHYTTVETFEIPEGWTQSIVVATSVLVFVNNYLFTFGTAITTPIFISIGGMLAIPTTVIIDWLAYGEPMTLYKILGTSVVAVGFVIVNVGCEKKSWDWCKEKFGIN